MAKRLAAIIFIFAATTVAWMILGATIMARTENFGMRLKDHVTSTWGTPQAQAPPTAWYNTEVENKSERGGWPQDRRTP